MSVRVERRGPVTTVVLARPEAANAVNAVDRRAGQALADAFCAFDADDDALAAVLCGEGRGLPFADAMTNELEHGLASLRAGAVESAGRFAGGEGRHGAPS